MQPLPCPTPHRAANRAAGLALLALACVLSSCKAPAPKIDGIPGNLPSIPLYGQARTPAHHMRPADYPFDANGNYVTSWAAQGGEAAGPSDYKSQRRVVESAPPRRSSSSSSSGRSSYTTPKKVTSAPPTKKSSSSSSSSKKSSGGGTKHVVKGSDTLYGLAKRYGTTVAKIKAANGLSSDVLKNGRTLTIP